MKKLKSNYFSFHNPYLPVQNESNTKEARERRENQKERQMISLLICAVVLVFVLKFK